MDKYLKNLKLEMVFLIGHTLKLNYMKLLMLEHQRKILYKAIDENRLWQETIIKI